MCSTSFAPTGRSTWFSSCTHSPRPFPPPPPPPLLLLLLLLLLCCCCCCLEPHCARACVWAARRAASSSKSCSPSSRRTRRRRCSPSSRRSSFSSSCSAALRHSFVLVDALLTLLIRLLCAQCLFTSLTSHRTNDRLFTCPHLQYLHDNGIIHRDLKVRAQYLN